MNEQERCTQDCITKAYNGISTWMEFCVSGKMSLKEFAERFDKFAKEREEGIKREREEENAAEKKEG